jgi:hypothetical protein
VGVLVDVLAGWLDPHLATSSATTAVTATETTSAVSARPAITRFENDAVRTASAAMPGT